jgi:pimeloyl-ACP methyl ester carboxylesterase
MPRGDTRILSWGGDINVMSQAVTVVLVHAAWADGSSWTKVITQLQSKGVRVVAAGIPMTSLKDDVKALEHTLEHVGGPVLLGGHAYSGAVVSAIHSDQVKGLMFIASLTPDEGETVLEVFTREKPHEKAPQVAPDANGLIWLPEQAFPDAFSHRSSREQAALFGALQRPINIACITEKAPKPSWKTKPSWYLIAEDDRMINPKAQRFLAERMRARIRSEKVDHVPMETAPGPVIEMFQDALNAVTSGSLA